MEFLAYFKMLYTKEPSTKHGSPIIRCFTPIESNSVANINSPISKQEVYKALFDMAP